MALRLNRITDRAKQIGNKWGPFLQRFLQPSADEPDAFTKTRRFVFRWGGGVAFLVVGVIFVISLFQGWFILNDVILNDVKIDR